MLFDYDLLVPAGTQKTRAVVQPVRLLYGTLTEIRIVFPPGPATLVHVAVRDRLHQIMPANADGDINFDDAYIVSKMEYAITDPPFELLLVGWSPEAIYDHTITFQFDIVPAGDQSWGEMIAHLFELQGTGRR